MQIPSSIVGALVLAACACAVPVRAQGIDGRLDRTDQASGTTVLLQAVSPVSDRVVWVSGHDATWARTTDGGATWTADTVPGADGMQFRDVAAFGADVAYLTDDGGRSWQRAPREGLPAALDGEGGFAASGTCAVAGPGGLGWIATGNGARARVLRTDDHGASWSATDVPVVVGPASGLATLSMDASGVGLALGGVIGDDTIRTDNAARTDDAGATWSLAPRLAMAGPAYGSALVPGSPALAVAVGPGGLDATFDGGATWTTQDTTTHWAVAFASAEAGWAVGPGGRITRLAFRPR